MAHLLVGPQDRGERGHLGLAVEVPEPHVGQPPSQLLEHLDGHRRRPVVALAQRREVAGVEVGVAQQRDPHRRRAEQLRHLLPLDRREQGGGLGRGQDDAGGAEVDVHGEEAVQLRAVVHRQRVRLDVVGGHLAVDHARHVLADQRPRRQQHALGPRLRAARVHEPQRVVVGHRDLGVVGRARAPPVVHVLPARRVAADPAPHARATCPPIAFSAVASSASSATIADAPEWPRMKAISSAFSMKLIGTSTTPSFAVANTSTANDQELRREQREPVALGEAPGGQRARGPVHRGVELGERVALVAVDDGELVGRALGGAAQEVAHRVLAGPRDGGGGVGAERHALTVDARATSRLAVQPLGGARSARLRPRSAQVAAAAQGQPVTRAALARSGQVALQPLDGQPVHRRRRAAAAGRRGRRARGACRARSRGRRATDRRTAWPAPPAARRRRRGWPTSSRSPTISRTAGAVRAVSSARATKSSSSAISSAAGCQG